MIQRKIKLALVCALLAAAFHSALSASAQNADLKSTQGTVRRRLTFKSGANFKDNVEDMRMLGRFSEGAINDELTVSPDGMRLAAAGKGGVVV